MDEATDELAFWLAFRTDIADKLKLIELELMLASLSTHTDDEHQFLIKKVRSFRETLTQIDQRIGELS